MPQARLQSVQGCLIPERGVYSRPREDDALLEPADVSAADQGALQLVHIGGSGGGGQRSVLAGR